MDLAILLGTDFCRKIRNIGTVTGLELIQEHRNIETILKNLDRNRYIVPDDFEQSYKEARRMFLKPDVVPGKSITLKWTEPDISGLTQFLSEKNVLTEDEIAQGIVQLTTIFRPGKHYEKNRVR